MAESPATPRGAGHERVQPQFLRKREGARPHFGTSLVVRPVAGEERVWELAQPLIYRVPSARGALSIVVPTGFRTDFASVPRFFHRLILPSGIHREAAVVHDFLYWHGDRDKVVADAIFFEAMGVLGVKAWKRWGMFLAVLFFGGAAWRQHREREKSEIRNPKSEATGKMETGKRGEGN